MDLSEGQLAQDDGRWLLTFELRLPHPPEKVWQAVTEPEGLAAWFPADIEGDRRAGAKLRFVFRADEGPTLEGEIREFDPPRRFEFTWDDDTYRIDLEPAGEGTHMTFRDWFSELGKAARDTSGWHVCLENLAAHLDGRPSVADPRARWEEVHARYVERFGAAAATIGPPS